ncbi:DinB family protein [Kitasatospora sp. NBC_01287]|uniref:DinB family protein n=1 Tax=Kitasatospora sp. NBC_01287 TaxID=2903573 RepID=UPI002250837B|nr:DinB family protein [Kitasatospora sp. NBC_01287]MCX4744667.1 DinB family protein [Kitasatospora sp. NBC_01287]
MDDTTDRLDPPFAADEGTMLASWLDFHRKTLALKTAGLTGEQLKRRPVSPSTLTLLGLVRHLAEVEHYWYQVVLLGGEPTYLYGTAEDPDFDFNGVADADPAEAFATWRQQIRLAEQAVGDLPLETVGKRLRRDDEVTLRWIQVHMIEEYARHNGHADLLREALDGVTGE